MQDNELAYIVPVSPKPIKIIHDDTFVDCNEDMTITIRGKATLSEIAEWFDMTVDELIYAKIGIWNCSTNEDS